MTPSLTAPLFATDAMRACFADDAWLGAMLRMEAALAEAQGAGALAAALRTMGPGQFDVVALGRAAAVAGVPTIPFVQAVKALLPAELEREFHKGATTQDILDTALVLLVRDALALVADDLDTILRGLAALAAVHRATPCTGRSYGQHAAPVTFGFKAAVWLAGIAEAAAGLPDLRARVLTASLGGPVGTLAGLGAQGPAVLDAFAAVLGLGVPSIAWHTRRGRIAGLGAWLAQLIGALAKLATDVASLASTEIAEVAEPYTEGRGGSTAMPHKRNPVSCTIILAAHVSAPGLASGLVTAMAAAHERPAGAWHGEWQAVPALFTLASGALREARVLAEGLEVDAPRMRRNLDLTHGLLFADAAASRLAPSLGSAAAHRLVERAAARVRDGAGDLAAVLAADPATAGIDLAPAFALDRAIAAAGPWVDRAIEEAEQVRALLAPEIRASRNMF